MNEKMVIRKKNDKNDNLQFFIHISPGPEHMLIILQFLSFITNTLAPRFLVSAKSIVYF